MRLSYWLVHTVGWPRMCPWSVPRTYVLVCILDGSSHPCRGHLLPTQYLNFKIDHIPTIVNPCGSLKLCCCYILHSSIMLPQLLLALAPVWASPTLFVMWWILFFFLMMFRWMMCCPIICVIQFSQSPIDPELLLTFSIPNQWNRMFIALVRFGWTFPFVTAYCFRYQVIGL